MLGEYIFVIMEADNDPGAFVFVATENISGCQSRFALCESFQEQPLQLFDVFRNKVQRFPGHFIHMSFSV